MRVLESWLWFAVAGLVTSVWHPWQGVAVIIAAMAFGAYQQWTGRRLEVLEARLDVLSDSLVSVREKSVNIQELSNRLHNNEADVAEMKGMRRLGL